jgi:hypothetical protein
MKRLTLCLVSVLLLTACPPNSYDKAGKLAKDFAASVLAAQQVEIQAHTLGYVPDDVHRTIQEKFSQLGDVGLSLDKAINLSHNAKDAKGQIDAATALLTDLSNNQITGIKDEKTRLGIQAAILSMQTILDTILAFGG